jgi:hypothetical protein
MSCTPKNVAVALIFSLILEGLTFASVSSSAAATMRATGSVKIHSARVVARRRNPVERTRLGLAALGVTGSYGYGDDYPLYGSEAFNHDRRLSTPTSHRAVMEGRGAAIDDNSSGYRAAGNRGAYLSPGSTYGRHTSDYGPGVTYASPVSLYRWAYSSENFPGTEFMSGQ